MQHRVTLHQLAKILRVSESQIMAWTKKGLKCHIVKKGGQSIIYYDINEVIFWLKYTDNIEG